MPEDRPWEYDPIEDEGTDPWGADPLAEEQPPKNPFAALAGSKIEAQPSFLSRLGTQAKGFAQELPLIGMRALDLVGDLGQGKKPWAPEVELERLERERKLTELLGGAKPGEPEQRWGRIAARMVPQAAAAYLTGGMSLPAQGAIQGGTAALQSLSEGASPEAALTSGAIGAATPGAGRAANALVSRVKAPFAGAVDQEILQAAERQGIELPASAITESSRARGLEQMGSRMMGGGKIEERGLRAMDDISGQAADMGAGANPMLAGQRTAADYAAERAALQGAKNAEYAKVGDLTNIPGVPQQTLDELDSLIQQGTLDPDTLANLRKLRGALEPAPLPQPAEAEALLKQFQNDPKMLDLLRSQGAIPEFQGPPTPRSAADLMSQQAGMEYGGPNALREAALSNRLRGNLGQDIDQILTQASPGQAAQLGKAKAAYGRYADLSESELGKRVSGFAERGQFDQIPKALLKPTASATDLKRLMEVSSPETQEQLRLNVIQAIVGTGERVTPKQIERGLKTWGSRLGVVLKPEQIQQLRDLSTLSKAMAKTTIGSPTAPLLQARKYIDAPGRLLARIIAGGAGGGLGGIPGAALGLGAEVGVESGLAKALGSKGGQRWLTRGFGPATLPGKVVRGAGVAASRIPSELERAERERELLAILGGGGAP